MTLEQLMKMGLTEEQAKQVMGLLDGNFVPKDRFNQLNTELKQAKDDLKSRDGQLEELKKSTGDAEALQKKITELQAENKSLDTAHAAEIKQLKRDSIDESLLHEVKAKNITAARALLAAVDATVDEAAYKTLRAEQIKKLAGDDATKFLFEAEAGQQGVFKGLKPGERKDGVPGAKNQPGTLAEAVKSHFEASE